MEKFQPEYEFNISLSWQSSDSVLIKATIASTSEGPTKHTLVTTSGSTEKLIVRGKEHQICEFKIPGGGELELLISTAHEAPKIITKL